MTKQTNPTLTELIAYVDSLSQVDRANWNFQHPDLYKHLWIVPHYTGHDDRWESDTLGTCCPVLGFTQADREAQVQSIVDAYVGGLNKWQRQRMLGFVWYWSGSTEKHYIDL